MSHYIQVSEDDNSEPIEVPTEMDGTLLLSTLSAQFPGACGLKYRNESTCAIRGIRLNDGHLFPPEDGWLDRVYNIVFSKGNPFVSLNPLFFFLSLKKLIVEKRNQIISSSPHYIIHKKKPV